MVSLVVSPMLVYLSKTYHLQRDRIVGAPTACSTSPTQQAGIASREILPSLHTARSIYATV